MAGLVRPITLTTVAARHLQMEIRPQRKGYHGGIAKANVPTAPIAAQDAFASTNLSMFPVDHRNAIAGHSPTASCELLRSQCTWPTGFKIKWAEKVGSPRH